MEIPRQKKKNTKTTRNKQTKGKKNTNKKENQNQQQNESKHDKINSNNCFPGISAISVPAHAVSHSPPPPPQEALFCLWVGLCTCCGPCGDHSDSYLAQFLCVLDPKVHSCQS